MIETADNDFFGTVEEETNRRSKDLENEEISTKLSIKMEDSHEHIDNNEVQPDEDAKQINRKDIKKNVDDDKMKEEKESLNDQ